MTLKSPHFPIILLMLPYGNNITKLPYGNNITKLCDSPQSDCKKNKNFTDFFEVKRLILDNTDRYSVICSRLSDRKVGSLLHCCNFYFINFVLLCVNTKCGRTELSKSRVGKSGILIR